MNTHLALEPMEQETSQFVCPKGKMGIGDACILGYALFVSPDNAVNRGSHDLAAAFRISTCEGTPKQGYCVLKLLQLDFLVRHHEQISMSPISETYHDNVALKFN